jgi:homoaconitase/3-isopropylmalate dehydratase large subunit
MFLSAALPGLATSVHPFPDDARGDNSYTGTNTFIDPTSGTVLVNLAQAGLIVGFTPSGTSWHAAVSAVCGAANGHVLVTANGQSVTLDASTGTQGRVTAATSSVCPLILPTGLGFDGTTLTQDL